MFKRFTFRCVTILIITISVAVQSGCVGKNKNADEANEFGKMLELTVWETQGTDYVARPEIDNNIVEEWLVKKTNVRVKNIYGNDGGQWDPKLTRLIAGDNLPDIVNCGSGQGAAHFNKLDQLGKVWRLTPEILQTYAPEVWRRIPEEQWKKLTINDAILGIPYKYAPQALVNDSSKGDFSEEDLKYIMQYQQTPTNDVMFDSGKIFWIRDDILKTIFPQAKGYNELVGILNERKEPIGEELLDIPIYTTQEYIDFMYKIKGLNLKSNNKTVYAFGYNGGDNWVALSYLGSDMYGYKGHNYASTWNSTTRSIEIPLAHDMIKQAAKTQNKMIRDKVIDPESLTHTEALYIQKILNGQYAIIPKGYLSLDINNELEKMGVEYRYRPFVTQVPALKGYEVGYDERGRNNWGASLCILKTLSEDEMHQVLNWINVQFSDEYQEIKAWGPKEAGLYKENPDGTREFLDPRFNKFYMDSDTTALEPKDTKGINGPSELGYYVGLYSVDPNKITRWSAPVLNRKISLLPVEGSGFAFKLDSEHVKNVKPIPPKAIWAPEYASLDEVVQYWGTREQWEAKFKIAFAADSDEQFEKAWQEALNTLNEIVNISEMERKMTEIARSLENE